MDITEFLLEILPNESSKLKKVELLKEHDDELLKEILHFVFNPMILTGISKAKLNKTVNPFNNVTITDLNTITDVMNYLKENNTGNDSDILSIQRFLSKSLGDKDSELSEKIITKDLQIGCTSATLNKAFGSNFIRKFDVQKAESYFKQKGPLKQSFFITEKLDGIRAVFFKYSNDNIIVYARSGKEITGLNEIKEAMKYMPSGYVYDGELLATNINNVASKDLFAITSSIVNSKIEDKTELIYNIFDMLPIKEFNNGESLDGAYIRVNKMQTFVDTASQKVLSYPPIKYVGDDESVIEELLDSVIEQGKEGLMISLVNGLYKTKRTKDLLKVKKMQTVDLLVTGFEEHKQGNKLGSLIVDYKGYAVNVGSGFSEEERVLMWVNRDALPGIIVEVQYFEETTNKKDDSLSLRFPVFKMVRNDKDEVSYH